MQKGYCYLVAAVGVEDGIFEPDGYSSGEKEKITVSGQIFEYVDPDARCHRLYDDLIDFYDMREQKTPHVQKFKKTKVSSILTLTDEYGSCMSADYIGPSPYWARVCGGMSDKEIGEMLLHARTIGGHMLWPVHRIPTINTARGGKNGFYDRIDLTLYEIRNMMMGNPQTKNAAVRRVIEEETEWCSLFYGEKGLMGFRNFIDNFRLNPFVCGDDYQVISLAESDLECGICIPVTMEEAVLPGDFRKYVKNNLFCIKQREE